MKDDHRREGDEFGGQPVSLLGLLHPGGATGDVTVVRLGIAVSLERGLAAVVRTLDDSGLLVIASPPWRRPRVSGYLRREGLEVVEVVTRGASGVTELVSLDPEALAFAQNLAPGGAAGRVATRWLRRGGARSRLVRTALPRVLVVAYRERRPPASWAAPSDADPAESVVVASSPGGERAYVYRLSARRPAPAMVAKVGLDAHGSERIEREAEALRTVAPAGASAGVQVPVLLGTTRIGVAPVLLESVVPGDLCARVIADRPERVDSLIATLSDWLIAWGAATAKSTLVDRDFVDTALLGARERLDGVLSPQLTDVIDEQARRLLDRSAQTTAAHNDLTMWNVVEAPSGEIGVLDWEEATTTALPMTDLFYALVDAVAAAARYVDRRAAFVACFAAGGARAEWARAVVDRQRAALGLDGDLVGAAFVSCWLRHAETDRARGGGRGFLPLLAELARAPRGFWPVESIVG